MYINRRYGFWMTVAWSKKPLIYGLIYASIITAIQYLSPLDISIPWQPISMMGITVAFYLGFKNNSAYDRTWEARKIWGAIVNNSRSFISGLEAFVQGENKKDIVKEITYRHIAWMTALRYQLRLSRVWEHTEERLNNHFNPVVCENYTGKLNEELLQYLHMDEIKAIAGKTNQATQILAMQSRRLEVLKNSGVINDFEHMELFRLLNSFYDEQGKSERIKNFPFPRQYSSAAVWMTKVFAALLPFAILDSFENGKSEALWLAAPFSALLIWVFFLMEMIGDYSENPFEGTYNDVPITTISRSIEIDLREMIGDEQIPKPIPVENGFQM
jgi:ion channel-forming bestrophin family protein